MNVNLLKHYIVHFITAKRNGHGVHSPFAYRLCEEVFYNQDSFYHFHTLNKIRQSLLGNESELEIEDLGAGSKTFKNKNRKVKDIAAKGISSATQSELLYKLSNFLNCKITLELGTSLGLNTLYLALVNQQGNVFTLEGSRQLVEFSKTLAQKQEVNNIRYIEGNFDITFSKVLESIPGIDLLYIDGNHTYEATLRYFEMALSKKHNNSVFIFDDIYWSKDMTKAWNQIKNNPEVRFSIDTFHFGIVFFRKEQKEKEALRLFISAKSR